MPEGVRAGHRVHWRVIGTGPRRCIALHCSLAHSGALKPLFERLGDLMTATVIDMPGHGRSADWRGPGPLQNAVVDIAASFLGEDDEPGQVDLVGHSFGGTSLLRLACEHPGRVRSLTLIEPPFYAAAEAAGAPEIATQRALDAPFARMQAEGDRRGAARAFTQVWGAGSQWEALTRDQQDYIVDRIHLIEGGGVGLNADYGGILAPGVLGRLICPVLLIRGTTSPPSVPAVLRALRDRLPDARIVTIEGAGHMVPITHPDAVAEAIRAFL